jgi:hypothetical protein
VLGIQRFTSSFWLEVLMTVTAECDDA